MTSGHETVRLKRARALKLLRQLHRAMPEAHIELHAETPLQLLVAVVLSAQTTDKRVNSVTPVLFRDFPTPQHYARATAVQLEKYIHTVGLFRNKAKNLVRLGQVLQAQHEGRVPTTRAALQQLPGVGSKTAGVVAMHLGTEKAFPVDTHVLRLSRRLGLSTKSHPEAVEADLQRLVPKSWWFQGHQLLVWHGRRCCFARKPACHQCKLVPLCPQKGVRQKKA